MVLGHENDYGSRWSANSSITEKIGCTSETVRRWVKMSERNSGSATTGGDANVRLKALERENRKLRQANEILRKASAYFAHAEIAAQASRLARRISRQYVDRPCRA